MKYEIATSWTHDYLSGLELAQFCWSGLPTLNPPGCRAPSGTKSFESPSQSHSCIVGALQGKMEKGRWNVVINRIVRNLYFKTNAYIWPLAEPFLPETLGSHSKNSPPGKLEKSLLVVKYVVASCLFMIPMMGFFFPVVRLILLICLHYLITVLQHRTLIKKALAFLSDVFSGYQYLCNVIVTQFATLNEIWKKNNNNQKH